MALRYWAEETYIILNYTQLSKTDFTETAIIPRALNGAPRLIKPFKLEHGSMFQAIKVILRKVKDFTDPQLLYIYMVNEDTKTDTLLTSLYILPSTAGVFTLQCFTAQYVNSANTFSYKIVNQTDGTTLSIDPEPINHVVSLLH